MDDNLKIIEGMLSKLDMKNTMEEFVAILHEAVEFIVSERDANEDTRNRMLALVEQRLDKIEDKNSETASIHKEQMMKMCTEYMDKFFASANAKIGNIEKEVSDMKAGKTEDEKRLTSSILSQVPQPEPQRYETPTETRDKLESLPQGDKLSISAIEGLEDELKRIEKVKATSSNVINAGIVGRDVIKDIDISSQLDGVTKTFNIQAVWNIISVDLSSFPYGSCRKSVDYTWTPTSITFTDQIDAATQLASGQTCILTVVTA